ncbi:MAG: hypothetical protein U0Q15_03355 [Kineosporiaceae bacterium]
MPEPHGLPDRVPLTPAGLAGVADSLATRAPLWLAVADERPLTRTERPLGPDDDDQPWGTRVASGEGWEAWLYAWEHGQVGDLHAHDGHGAIALLRGVLLEDVPGAGGGVLEPGRVHPFAAGHRHGLAALSGPAVSLHVVARAFSATQPVRRRGPAEALAHSTTRTTGTTATHPQRRPAASSRRSR